MNLVNCSSINVDTTSFISSFFATYFKFKVLNFDFSGIVTLNQICNFQDGVESVCRELYKQISQKKNKHR